MIHGWHLSVQVRCSPHYQLKHTYTYYSQHKIKTNPCYFTTFSKWIISLLYPYSPLPSSLGLSWLGVGLPSYSQRAVAPAWEERRRVRGCARWSPGLKDCEIPPLPLPRAQPCRDPSLRRPVRRFALGCSSSARDATLLSRLGETGALMGSSWTEGRNFEQCYFEKQKWDIFLLLWMNLTNLIF